MMRLAMLHTRLRVEERLLLERFKAAGIAVEPIDLRDVHFDLAHAGRWDEFDAVLDRSLSLTSSLTAVRVLERFGVRCVNPARVIEVASDKLASSLELEAAGVPTPRVRVATSPGAALEAIERMGYPAVLKPTVGSWGRLIARVNDRDAAEAVLEHRATLGSPAHSVFYIQEYVEKRGRDIRAFVVGEEPVAAIVRTSEHWITNTARGGAASNLPIGPELGSICRRAAACVGADLLAIDLFECSQRGLLVNEFNHSMEFRNSIETTGVDIPRLMVEHVARIARETGAPAETPA